MVRCVLDWRGEGTDVRANAADEDFAEHGGRGGETGAERCGWLFLVDGERGLYYLLALVLYVGWTFERVDLAPSWTNLECRWCDARAGAL